MKEKKKKNKQIFVVTSGDYSDYHIESVFSTRHKAKNFIEKFDWYDDFRIEPFELDNESCNGEPIPKKVYYVEIDENGKEIFRKESTPKGGSMGDDTENLYGIDSYGEVDSYYHNEGGRSRKVSAKSERGFDVALKIARDGLAEWKAKKEGIA